MARNRIKQPIYVLRNRKEKGHFLRFFRLDYPIYHLPVRIMERMSEPYESLEWFMMRFLYEGNVETEEELSHRLGISQQSSIFQETLLHLRSIGHLVGEEGQLSVTPLGAESCEKREKMYEAETRRMLYFDALSLEPLPRDFYEDSSFQIVDIEDREILHDSYVFDLWSGMADDHINRLLQLDGNERFKRNLPQEMESIQILYDQLANDDEYSQEGHILFCPLYVGILEDSETVEVYQAIDGKRSPFFEHLLRKNLVTLKEIISFDSTDDFVEDLSQFETANILLSDWLDVDSLLVSSEGKMTYVIYEEDVDRWEGNKEIMNRIIRHLPYTNDIPISHDQWKGYCIRLTIFNEAVFDRLWKLIKEQNTNYYKNQEYSDTYIAGKNKKLYELFQQKYLEKIGVSL